MGKAGKERKRRKLENHQSIVDNDDDEELSDTDGDNMTTVNDLPIAIHALDILGQRIDLYRSKAMKGVRSALFPLIEVQIKKSAFFEIRSSSIINETAEATLTSSLDSLLRIASMLSSDLTSFLSFEMKEFRHALHPLVHFTQQKDKQGESSSELGVGTNTSTSIVPNEGVSSSVSVPACVEQSYAQRISTLFRANQWTKALAALHAMRTESHEIPKLGTIQRWVRECDLVRVSGEAGCENLSWLLLDATMRLQDTAKAVDNNHGNGNGTNSNGNGSSSGGGSGRGSSSSIAGSQDKHQDKGLEKDQHKDKGSSGMIPHTAVVTRHPVFRSQNHHHHHNHHNNTNDTTTTTTTTNNNNNNATTITNNIASTTTTVTTATTNAEYIQSRVSVLAHVAGPHRRPPSGTRQYINPTLLYPYYS